jgi:molybdate transport system substrate-binding protein
MATRQVLTGLAPACAAAVGAELVIESVGGVDAARRVQAGEAFDLVLLAQDALQALADAGHVDGRTLRGFVRSPMAVAVRLGTAPPNVQTEQALAAAVRAAARIGYSTGPSGAHVLRLVERWCPAGDARPQLVQAPPGVPVAELIANGDVDLGFQQLPELVGHPRVVVAGTLPPPVDLVTTFAGAVGARSGHPQLAARALAWLSSPAADDMRRRFGMLAPEASAR